MRIYWFFNCTNLNLLHPRMLCGSGEEDLLISSMYFPYFIMNPFEKGMALHLNKLCCVTGIVKHILTTRHKIGWNWPSDSWEENEIVNSLQTFRQTDRWTDGQQVTRKAHLSFQSRWAKNLIVTSYISLLRLKIEIILSLKG